MSTQPVIETMSKCDDEISKIAKSMLTFRGVCSERPNSQPMGPVDSRPIHQVLIAEAISLDALPSDDVTVPSSLKRQKIDDTKWCSKFLPYIKTPLQILQENIKKQFPLIHGYQPILYGPCQQCASASELDDAHYVVEYVPYHCPEEMCDALARGRVIRDDSLAPCLRSKNCSSTPHHHLPKDISDIDPDRVVYQMAPFIMTPAKRYATTPETRQDIGSK
jgi:hypothetical protein